MFFPYLSPSSVETPLGLTTTMLTSPSYASHRSSLRQRRHSVHDCDSNPSRSRNSKNNIKTILISICVIWSMLSFSVIIGYVLFSNDFNQSNPSQLINSINNPSNNRKNNLYQDNLNKLHDFEDTFEGPRWINNAQTLDKEVFFENKWISLSRHTVRTHPKIDKSNNIIDSNTIETGQSSRRSIAAIKEDLKEPKSKTIDDWFWIDSMDTVNILATTLINNVEYFIIFEQTKYGINGLTYGVIGGHIESIDNNAEIAAKRELFEELGMVTNESLIEFNKNEGFRTDVNRGLGFCHTFLARNVVFEDEQLRSLNSIEEIEQNMRFFDETEELRVKLVELNELIDFYQQGLFKEAKWSNTVGLGIMYILLHDSNIDNNGNKYMLL